MKNVEVRSRSFSINFPYPYPVRKARLIRADIESSTCSSIIPLSNKIIVIIAEPKQRTGRMRYQ
ncbi:hypothetical protein D3C84_1233790 [compost metagenome]